MERGYKTDMLLNKSEELMLTSYAYKTTATKVKKTMCVRKFKMIAFAILIILVSKLLEFIILAGCVNNFVFYMWIYIQKMQQVMINYYFHQN